MNFKYHIFVSAFLVSFSCFALTQRLLVAQESNNETSKEADSKEVLIDNLTAVEQKLAKRIFASRLLEIASEYKGYERVDQTIRWAPTLCSMPPRLPANQGAFSASDSKDTHGQKLYYLYARKPWEYKSDIWGEGRNKKPVRAALGQVLVKEAWNPVEVDKSIVEKPSKKANDKSLPKSKRVDKKPYAKAKDKYYQAGTKKGLFIMFKTAEKTPGTDRGWVYGTVSADGSKVLSVGKVESCIQCHQSSPFDRQIGLSSLLDRSKK